MPKRHPSKAALAPAVSAELIVRRIYLVRGHKVECTPRLRHGKQGHFSLNGKESELSSKNRVFSPEFRIEVAKRILNGASVTSIHRELDIKRSLLYRWVHAYGEEGEQGLRRPVGRPTGPGIRVRRPSLTETEQLRQRRSKFGLGQRIIS